jgi:HEAT repeat protein
MIGVLALWAGVQFLPRNSGRQANPEPASPVVEPPSPAKGEPPGSARKAVEAVAAQVTAPEPVTTKHEDYVAARCEELEDLAMDDRPESLATILEELTNRDPHIRQAAISAAKQFGSRDAIPKLLDAATQTDDPEEKVALLEAAEFLKLPSLTELAQQARTNAVSGSR